ncbi:uncharacterized protein A4U43_C03F31090 [Asparagus officinalis]|uniref:SAM domain-containing protein n=1 Tax=Asparagus officinalis TaxID=4686 RepID=A0A5P1FJ62_ASPOF|nr:uncharacterized protein A4U43_C03F31090 [Asparagus officinalis]
MDWYSWLSKSNLEPSNVYAYTLLFIQNEIEEEDVVHFSHEFLKSMGVSIAKHRLEILKLANKLDRRRPPHHRPLAGLLSAVNRTKSCLIRYFNALVVGRDRSAIVV